VVLRNRDQLANLIEFIVQKLEVVSEEVLLNVSHTHVEPTWCDLPLLQLTLWVLRLHLHQLLVDFGRLLNQILGHE